MSRKDAGDEGSESIGPLFLTRTAYARGKVEGARPRARRVPLYLEYPQRIRCQLLPELEPQGGAPLWEVIAARRSLRDYLAQPISAENLNRLLWATQGVTESTGGRELRASPSAGAQYPLETYLVVNRVTSVPPGLYHYRVREGDLELMKEGELGPALARACLDQRMMAEAAVCFAWTAVFARSTWRYAERAYRYFFLDAGHLGAQLHLAAVALGLGCCAVGAFYDGEVNEILGVDGESETALYLSSVGPV